MTRVPGRPFSTRPPHTGRPMSRVHPSRCLPVLPGSSHSATCIANRAAVPARDPANRAGAARRRRVGTYSMRARAYSVPGTLLYRPMPPAAAPVANEAAGRWRRCSPRECSRARGRIRIGSTEPVRGLHARQTVPSCTGRGVHVCSTSRLPQPHGALPPLQEIRSVHRTHCSQSQP